MSQTALKDKVRHALNEGRILILGSQVLLGFQFRAVLEPRFEHLPAAAQWAKLAGLGLLIVAFALLVAPAAYHRIVERGDVSGRLHRFATAMIGAALLPFAVAFGIDVFVLAAALTSQWAAGVAGAAVVLLALGCWYALPLARRGAPKEETMEERQPTSLKDRIEHVLTEIRMVLPGAQALLGFGFAAILMDAFEHLPRSSQAIHVAGVGCVLLATILLMTPASRHRLAERGEDTEAFHRFAGRMLLLAMIALAGGVAAQLLVVVRRVQGSLGLALAAALAALALCFGLWFGLTLWLRAQAASAAGARPAAEREAA